MAKGPRKHSAGAHRTFQGRPHAGGDHSDPCPRETAARAVQEVWDQGRSLTAVLPRYLARLPADQRGFTQALCYGTLRWGLRLDAIAGELVEKPLRSRDRDVHFLLLVGLYQLIHLDTPPHAAVSETVAAADRLGKGWARGLLNGVLRRFLRERATIEATVDRDDAAALAHPPWLLEELRAAWPGEWCAIAEANNAHPPMTLRVNRLRSSREAYLEALRAAGIAAAPTRYAPDGVQLVEPVGVERLPGFAEGACSVQDEAAQLAALLLDPAPSERVLDACAAPGGKTGHLLEIAPDAEVVALDRDPERLERVRENLDRLGVRATVLAGDAAEPAGWWDGRPFDRILLDAPCSATGVIRRHPDIKLLRRREDIDVLAAEQARLLRALWPLLRAGGLLVYATCSILPQENARQITTFLSERDDARVVGPNTEWGRAAETGRQILPGEDAMDGFYFAALIKAR